MSSYHLPHKIVVRIHRNDICNTVYAEDKFTSWQLLNKNNNNELLNGWEGNQENFRLLSKNEILWLRDIRTFLETCIYWCQISMHSVKAIFPFFHLSQNKYPCDFYLLILVQNTNSPFFISSGSYLKYLKTVYIESLTLGNLTLYIYRQRE